MKIVDPLNPIPKYLQITAWLKERIQTGTYKEGQKLPSEIELSKLCEVNRHTLRQAISTLTADGILRKEKGTGTFVSSSIPVTLKHKLERISSFRDDLSDSELVENTRTLIAGIENATEHVADALDLGPDSKVVAIRRMRTGNDIPLIFEESYLPGRLFKDILNMDLSGSMYEILSERFQTVLARCEQTIRAINMTGNIAKLFNLPKNSAGLYMESITYNDNGVPVEVLCSYYRGDKYIFEIELGRYLLQENHVNTLAVK
ncbi:MAG TPA: GntR family transcriptional regulator [Deltaproteobacteria bacterium]|nr:GntR family transcriptional regulator [Deltaproteobacteria bacterium]